MSASQLILAASTLDHNPVAGESLEFAAHGIAMHTERCRDVRHRSGTPTSAELVVHATNFDGLSGRHGS
jgi:hypothetical protein